MKLIRIVQGVLLLFLSANLVGQSTKSDGKLPGFELFGGYSFDHSSTEFIALGQRFDGWEASFSGNLNRHFALKADVAGRYSSTKQSGQLLIVPGAVTFDVPTRDTEAKVHTFLFGPEFSFRRSSRKIFVHSLIGVTHVNRTDVDEGVIRLNGVPVAPTPESFLITRTAFSAAIGGGLDLYLNRRFGWRAVQLDYVLNNYGNFFGGVEHNFRASTGLVFRFGK